jgi:hypothetical protein
VFVFTVPSDGFHDCLAGPFLPWGDRNQYLQSIDRRCAHRRYWGEPQWRDCLGRHGIDVVGAVSYLSASEVRRWETLSRFTADLLFGLLRGRMQPIEIQRTLRLRRRALRLPAWLAAAVAEAVSAGVGADPSGRSGCLLVEATRRP